MVVDSSIWIEIVFDGPLRKKCEEILKTAEVLVPALIIYEVYRKLKKQVSEEIAIEVISSISKYPTLEINRDISILAADLSLEYSLGMADSVVLACAKLNKTELVTLDNDFAKIPDVKILR